MDKVVVEPKQVSHLNHTKNTQKDLTNKEKQYSGDLLTPNHSGDTRNFIHRQTDPTQVQTGGNRNFTPHDGPKMDHLGLAETGQHWPSLQYDDRKPHRFIGNFMSHQLDSTVAYNKHDMLSGSYQFGGTASLDTGNLSVRKVGSESDAIGLGRWSYQRFRDQKNSTLRISTFYRPVPPNQCGGTGSMYAQHLTLFNNTGRIECPRYAFFLDFAEEISIWSKEGDQIIVSGDLNEHINSEKVES